MLDSPRPAIALREYAYNENRYRILLRSDPDEAERLMKMAQDAVNRKWSTYEYLSMQEPAHFEAAG